MQKDYSPDKPKILFIASNIPTPKRNSNRVVITIAQKLIDYFDITLLHPAEYAPFPVSLMKKYRNIADKKRWKSGELDIIPFKYLRLPTLPLSFLILPLFKRKLIKTLNKIGRFSLVHAHFILPDGFMALMLKKSHNIPFVISVRATDVNYLKRLIKTSIYTGYIWKFSVILQRCTSTTRIIKNILRALVSRVH